MEKYIYDEKNGLHYELVGDYYLPCLIAPELPTLGFWGHSRLTHLQNNQKILYLSLLTSGKLGDHLQEIDRTAAQRRTMLTHQMAQAAGITEALKATDQIAWVQQMNAHTREMYTLLTEVLQEMPLITASPLEATFVAWLDCRRLNLTDKEIEHFFMEDALLWTDWGEEYGPGGSGFVRMNIATTRERLTTALDNLKKAYKARF